MVQQETIVFLDKLFGEWLKGITILISLTAGVILLFFSLKYKWIDQSFAMELIFFILGIVIGLWLEKQQKIKTTKEDKK